MLKLLQKFATEIYNIRFSAGAIFTFIFIAFFAMSCIPENNEPTDTLLPGMIDFDNYTKDYESLPGDWEWLQTTTGYYSGIPFTETPESIGVTKLLVISPDMEINFFENDTLQFEGMVEDFLQNTADWGIRGDTLATTNAINDGPEIIYLRKENNSVSDDVE